MKEEMPFDSENCGNILRFQNEKIKWRKINQN